MKYVIVLPDGAADDPLADLGGRTPLEAARIPHMDRIALEGRLGTIETIPPGFTPGTDVGTLTLMGYDPRASYTGRAPIEAAAQGLEARPDQLIFRCNFVTIDGGLMRDNTAGHIGQQEADELIASLNGLLGAEGCAFHSGVSYRNLLFVSQASDWELALAPPHDILDQAVADHPPRGRGAERVRGIMARASELLRDHPVNRSRIAAGHKPATDIWLWGQGKPGALESWERLYGLRGAVIAAVDIIRGLAVGMGMDLIHVPGATGYLDTDYAGKGRAAIEALGRYDVVIVHVEAPDEAGHQGLAAEKVKALERIDEAVVAPLLEALPETGEWRILVATDHATPVATRAHAGPPVPFAFSGSGVSPVERRPFTEAGALAGGWRIEPPNAMIRAFLGR